MTQGDAIPLPSEHARPFGAFLGPWPQRVELEVERLERVDCGRYVWEKASYAVAEGQRALAYVCIPMGRDSRLQAVLCHHQHAREFRAGQERRLRGDA